MAKKREAGKPAASPGRAAALPFTGEELITLLEAARVALNDADVFDQIVEDMDISDEAMRGLRERLQAYLDS